MGEETQSLGQNERGKVWGRSRYWARILGSNTILKFRMIEKIGENNKDLHSLALESL